MPVELHHIREHLLPGLHTVWYESLHDGLWWHFPEGPLLMPGKIVWVPKTPAIILPKVSFPVAAGLALGAAIVRNPVVSRRFWSGWSL